MLGNDIENRLVSTSAGAGLIYDPLGRLYRTSGGAQGTTDFLYDGDALVAEYDASSGAMRRRYMHGPGVDEPILWDEGSAMNCSATRFLHADHEGSIIALVNCSGNRVAVDSYDEYGIPAAGNYSASLPQRFQYTGQIWLPELGMYYYKARMYSPTLGRFLQTDPIGYKDQVNLYAYVGNDPINAGDPMGMCTGSLIANKDGTCASTGGFTTDSVGAAQGTIINAAKAAIANATTPSQSGSTPGSKSVSSSRTGQSIIPPPKLPGGPYTEKPSSPGNRAGSFQGPKQSAGPRSQAQWVPPEGQGGPPGSQGYWKVQTPGQQGWERYSPNGQPLTPEQAHPGSIGPTRSPIFLGPIGALLCTLFCESPAH